MRTQQADGGSEASLVYVVGRVNQGIRREMRSRLATLGLSVPEYTALSVLRARPGLSNAQLARRSLLAPQSMLEVLAKLEQRGLVRREADPTHSRILRAALTGKGRRLLARADPAIAAIQEWILADVPEGDRAVVLAGMLSAMRTLSAREESPAPTPGAARAAARRSP
ncbi:MAG TPA: MarR family winged helix-turn-helix transcriptional regulator [Solirubrobacteraceae bacterium]|nr:MarR family winged helix-turn-helix transcriptional regulator [Solirubrobacteraceae bacterium]